MSMADHHQIESCVPPGFRFHPTEEELVGYYLKRKVNSLKFDLDVIIEIDLYRMEPWDIQDKCKFGCDERNEWYFFSHKDRKYPTGTRTNRATSAGFWKATGRDKAVLAKNKIIGMRKTLVFYKGRAPNGRKTDWIMHEYRLQTSEHAPPQEEGWVVCRAFKKPSPSHHKQGFESWNHQNNWFYNMRQTNTAFDSTRLIGSPSIPDISSPADPSDSLTQPHYTNNPDHHHHRHNTIMHPHQQPHHHHPNNNYTSRFEQELITSHGANNNNNLIDNQQLIIDLPRLDSPSLSTSFATKEAAYDHINDNNKNNHEGSSSSSKHWEILDNLLGSSSAIVLPEVTTTTTTSSSYPNNNPLVPHDYELEVHNQLGNFLECFPEL